MTDKDKKAKPIDVDKIDLDLMKKHATDMPGLLEYAHSVGGFSIVPTKEGAIKGRALKVMEEQTNMQMDQIFQQMKLLAEQAQKIKSRAEISVEIYDATLGFEPLVGNSYFLYEKSNGKKLVSMVSPKEWGDKIPFERYIAQVKLLADHTWDVIEEN